MPRQTGVVTPRGGTRQRSLTSRIFRLVWQPPLYAIPFGLFFGVLNGMSRFSFVISYQIAWVFALSIRSAYLVFELVAERLWRDRRAIALEGRIGLSLVASVLPALIGSGIAALIVQEYVYPGLLGNVQSIAATVLFTLLFTFLGVAVSFAVLFYRRAVSTARAEQELQVAHRIQEAFLVSRFPTDDGFDVHAVSRPSREVSGDFYDVIEVGPGVWLLAIADVAGKGVPAALMSAMLLASVRTQASLAVPLDRLTEKLNELIWHSASRHQFATCFLARADLGAQRLTYVNAGHNPPYLIGSDGRRVTLGTSGIAIGLQRHPTFREVSIDLRPGDRLFCFTDGVTEAIDMRDEIYDDDRLVRVLDALPGHLSAEAVTSRVLDDVGRFTGGAESRDDITVLTARFGRGPA